MIDPRLRQRVEVVPVRPGIRLGVTNEELVESFSRSSKLSKSALRSYTGSIRDFVRFMKHPEGREVPAKEWSKEGVWAYLHFVEANYCANWRVAGYAGKEAAICRQRVWVGPRPAAEAARSCVECPKFKRPMIQHRVNALSKFFKYLARVGAIAHNVMQDVVAEYWEENPPRDQADEKRRNPTVEEVRRLVNGTLRPNARAFYAASAKWWFRPNEMFMVDRYASFGIHPPAGVSTPEGFEEGFPANPNLSSFEEGGDLVYLPRKLDGPDKRQGNRWSVIDAELRPIIEQYFAWWERMVKRDEKGVPTTSAMWINERGQPFQQVSMYRGGFFHDDCLRLGLVTKAELRNPRRTWTAHCQRHFGEKLLEMHNVPDNWCNHFRGDKMKDARGHYFKPEPLQVRQKYLELVPLIGFVPLPDVARYASAETSEIAAHRETLREEIRRAYEQRRRTVQASSVRIENPSEALVVPRRIVAAVLFALKIEKPGSEWHLGLDKTGTVGREFEKEKLVEVCDRALRALSTR